MCVCKCMRMFRVIVIVFGEVLCVFLCRRGGVISCLHEIKEG